MIDRASILWKDIPRIRDFTRSSRRINLPIAYKSVVHRWRKCGGRQVTTFPLGTKAFVIPSIQGKRSIEWQRLPGGIPLNSSSSLKIFVMNLSKREFFKTEKRIWKYYFTYKSIITISLSLISLKCNIVIRHTRS